jgi:serine/threonine protein kinase
MIGKTLGRYVITSEIGHGGMGVVYRARDPLLNREIAIKVLSDNPSISEIGREQLLHEARAASALNHPNICAIHEIGEHDGRFFIVMELVDGKPLSEIAAPLGIPFEAVRRYGVQIAEALAHAHDRGIIHRDLKSSNVAITADGRVKVLDFGLARFVDRSEPNSATKSLASVVDATGITGTLPYMAPEQFRGDRLDHRVDIWALGVILYEAAGGQVPFRGSTPFALGASIINDPPPPLPKNIPPGLTAVIQRCLAKDLAVRYQRASEVSAALGVIQVASVSTPAGPSGQRTPPTVLRSLHHIHWEPLSRGLPRRNAYETVLRDSLAADSFDSTGIYFGTRSGRLYGSRDNGKSWETILEGLPPIVCVKAACYAPASNGKNAKAVSSVPRGSARQSKKTWAAKETKARSRR